MINKRSSSSVPVVRSRRQSVGSRGAASQGAQLRNLLDSWERSLKARIVSDRTIGDYTQAVRYALEYWEGLLDGPRRVGEVTRAHCEEWLVHCADRMLKPGTIFTYHKCLRLFFAWCADPDEGEIAVNPMLQIKRPKLDEGTPPPVLEPAEVSRLLRSCNGPRFSDRRDLAMLRLMFDTGMRRMEVCGMLLADVDLNGMTVTVRRKGRKAKLDQLPFGPKTAAALDRYLRARDSQPHADSPAFWITSRGRLSYSTLYDIVSGRAEAAGLSHIYPHVARHTFSGNWLDMGGQEGDLIALNGWSPAGARAMLERYTRRQSQRRARDAHKRLAPGDQY